MRIIDLDNLSEKEKKKVLNEQNKYVEERKQESLNLQNRANEEFNNLTRYIDTRKTQIAPVKNVVSRFSNMGQSASTGIKRGVLNKITNVTNRGRYIGKNLEVGTLQGTAGIPQAILTESANEMRKGKEKDANGILNQIGKAIVNNKANNVIDDTIRITKSDLDTIKNKDKNLWEKLVGITTNHVSESAKMVTPGYSTFSALNQATGKIAPQASDIALDINQKISAPIKYLQQQLAEEGQNYDGVTRTLGEGANVIGNMAPSIATSAITKNPEMALGVMGLSAKGQSTKEALDKGANLDEAVKIGDTKGLVEVGTELATGGAKIFGGGTTAEQALRKQIKDKVGSKVLQAIANTGLDIAGEGLEETVSDIVDTAIDKGTTDPNASYSLKDWGKTQGITALTTLALNGLGIGGNAITQRINNIATAPINNQQNQTQNEQILPTQPIPPINNTEDINPYRDTARANKLIKEKNELIRQVETDMQQTTFPQAKNILNQRINQIENEYNQKIQNLYDNTNKTNNIPYRSGQDIANDNSLSNLDAIREETQKVNTPELKTAESASNNMTNLSDNSSLTSPTIDYIKQKRSNEKTGIKEIKDTLAQKFVNKGHYIDKLANKTGNKNLTYLYDRTMNTFNEAQISIGDYQINSKGEKVGKSIIDIFKNAEDSHLSTEFDDYLLNKHNISRYAHEKGIFGSEISAKDSQNIVNNYEKIHPEFKQWSEEVSKYNDNNLRDLVNNGLVSEETYKSLKELYGDYVPTYRDITDNIAQYTDDNVGSNTLKRATQSDLDILSVKESMAEQTLAIKKAIRMNNLGLELYKTLGKDSTITNINGFDALAMQTLAGNVIDSAGKGQNTFTIFKDGEMIQFKISDELYTAFEKDTLQNKINNNKVAKALLTPVEKLTKAQRELLTTYSVGFAMNNPIKDFQDALFNSKYSGARFVKNWTKALYNIGTKGSWYENYRNNGGTANTYFDYDKGIIPVNTKNPVKKFFSKIKSVNEVLEQAPRLAEYISTIETGGSIDEALYNAAEITTNFKRGGDITKAVNKYGANFLNASVQGLDKAYRNLTGQNGWKGYARLITKATLYQIAPALINGILLGDDEDYEDLPEYTKDNYFLFKMGNGKFFRIPKGRPSSVIGGIARRALETIEGKEVDWKSLVDTAINQMAPNNPLTDNVIAPIVQAAKNKSWYGGDIVGKRLQKLPVKEQYDESTDAFSKWLGEKINVSPKKINYVLDQYSGGIGDVVLPMMTPQAENNIIEDKFTTDSVMKNKNVSKYFSTVEELEKKKNSGQATDKDKLEYKYFTENSKDITDLYAKKREIQNSDKPDKEKKEELRKVQKQINDIVEKKLDTFKNVSITGTTAKVNNTEYYKYKEEWTALTDKEKEKNKNISLKNYADYKNKVYNLSQKKKQDEESVTAKDKMQILLDSDYSNNQKSAIYENYIASKNKEDTISTYEIMKNAGLNINEWLKYSQQEFESDKEDDGTINGKSVSSNEAGSKKNKFTKYINSMNITGNQRILLYAIQGYKTTSAQKKQLVNYVQSLDLDSSNKLKIYNKFNGFTVYKNGTIKY